MMLNNIIIGAGPVGLSCALMRAHVGATVTLIDKSELSVAAQDARSLALSFGSIQILQSLGLDLNQMAHVPIERIHISEQNGWGQTQLHQTDMNVPMLGAVVRYGELVAQLTALTQAQPNIQQIRPAFMTDLNESDHQVQLTLNTQQKLNTNVLIHAEGGVFQPAHTDSAATQQHDYQQTAIIANVTLRNPKPAWAWERFTEQGPCALLPASNDGLSFNLVWCMSPARADALILMSDAEFLAQLNPVVQHLTGTISAVGARNAFPLGLKRVAELHAKNRIAIGNAAQTLHPVAGQGFNLGLRDAFVLHQTLNQQPSISQAIAHFTQQRQADRNATTRITDMLARGFFTDFGMTHLRSAGFSFMNALPFVKNKVARQFMFGTR